MSRSVVRFVFVLALAFAGCSSHGQGDAAAGAPDAGEGDGIARAYTPPRDPGPGGLLFAASGELLALTGYPFPPANADAPAFVDGWEIHFTRLLATVDRLTLSSNPDVSPGDQSLTGSPPGAIGGGLVAEVDGPWALDLADDGPASLSGMGDPGVKAIPFASLDNQNKKGGGKFATDGTRYAFGFDVVAATTSAANVNLDADAQADYTAMVEEGCTVLYVGTATFRGGTVPGYTSCNAGHDGWPAPGVPVPFRFCFKSPTSYLNCQDGSNMAEGLKGEEHPRGVAVSSSASTLVQLTLHTDHPFWDSVLHDAPAHFDQFAGQLVGRTGEVATLDLVKGLDFGAVPDGTGALMTWRACLAPPTDVHAVFTGTMAFDRQSVPRAVGDDPATGLRDLYDFVTYNQSTQGHLDADGLCYVQRNYPSPR